MPDLAESWSWDDEQDEADLQAAPGREMARRQAVHREGRPVHLGHAASARPTTRTSARTRARSGTTNLEEVTLNGDYEATFVLKEPQPAFLLLLASGYSPVYPCHVPQRDMRTKPVGTGPFKFVEFKRERVIKLAREPGLLEEGPALSRRHRVQDRREPLDPHPRLRRRRVRHDVPDRRHHPAGRGHEVAGAAGDLRDLRRPASPTT